MPALTTYTADIQDRDGGPGVSEQACDSFPALACIFADGGYSGDSVKDAFKAFDGPAIEIVKRPRASPASSSSPGSAGWWKEHSPSLDAAADRPRTGRLPSHP